MNIFSIKLLNYECNWKLSEVTKYSTSEKPLVTISTHLIIQNIYIFLELFTAGTIPHLTFWYLCHVGSAISTEIMGHIVQTSKLEVLLQLPWDHITNWEREWERSQKNSLSQCIRASELESFASISYSHESTRCGFYEYINSGNEMVPWRNIRILYKSDYSQASKRWSHLSVFSSWGIGLHTGKSSYNNQC